MPGYIEQRDGYGWASSGTISDDLASDENGVFFKLQADTTLTKTIRVDKIAGAPVYIRKVLRFYEYQGTGTDINIATTGLVYNLDNDAEATNLPIGANATLDVIVEGYATTHVAIAITADNGDYVKIYLLAESGV